MTDIPRNLHDLVGQEAAAAILTTSVREQRVGHAYLFVGPDGIGKLTAALLFAKALNCRQPPAPAVACGACSSCQRLEHGNHPQIWRIAPMYRKQPITDPRLLELVEDQAWITIAQTRGDDRDRPPHPPVLREAALKPVFSPYKVFVFEPADRMTEEAADSLLATLEEPPAGTVFILVSARPAAMRETVVSRCEQVRFHMVAPQRIEELLISRGVEPERARLIAGLADGRPGRALAMAQRPYLLEVREEAIALAEELFAAPLQAALAMSSRTLDAAARLWELELAAIIEQEREAGPPAGQAPAQPARRARRGRGGSPAPPAPAGSEPNSESQDQAADESDTAVEAEKLRISYTRAMRHAAPQILNMMAGWLRDVMVAKGGAGPGIPPTTTGQKTNFRPTDLMINRDHVEQAQRRAGEVDYDALRRAIDVLARTESYIRSYVNLEPALEGMYVELAEVFAGTPV